MWPLDVVEADPVANDSAGVLQGLEGGDAGTTRRRSCRTSRPTVSSFSTCPNSRTISRGSPLARKTRTVTTCLFRRKDGPGRACGHRTGRFGVQDRISCGGQDTALRPAADNPRSGGVLIAIIYKYFRQLPAISVHGHLTDRPAQTQAPRA